VSRNLTLNGIRRSIHHLLVITVISIMIVMSRIGRQKVHKLSFEEEVVFNYCNLVWEFVMHKNKVHTHSFFPPKSGALYKPLSPKKIAPNRNLIEHLFCSYTFHFRAHVMLQLKLQTSRVLFLLVAVISEV